MLSTVFVIISAVLWKYQFSLIKSQRDRQIEGEAVLATILSGPQLRQELIFAKDTLKRIEENLSSEDNLDGSLTYFYALETETGAHIEDIHPLTAAVNDSNASFKRIPFALKISGNYLQVALFLQTIEIGSKPVNITYFSLRRRTSNSSQIVLDISLDLLGRIR